MIEIILFISITLIIITSVEFFTYFRKKGSVNVYNYNKNIITNLKTSDVINFKTEESSSNTLDKYSTNSDIEIQHSPGKFLVKNNNIFIKIKDRVIIPELNVIYNISESFKVEIINMTGENIHYYYKKIFP